MTSYTISNTEHPTRPGLVVTDEDGNSVGIAYTTSVIASGTDSHDITEECSEFVLGTIISVEHDRDVIHVTTE